MGASTEEELIDLVKKTKFILEEASLPSGKYCSCSEKALQEFPPNLVSKKEKVSILGSIWEPKRDVLTFNMIAPPGPYSSTIKSKHKREEDHEEEETATAAAAKREDFPEEELEEEQILTKRSILSTVARIFDSLGLIGPYSLCFKLLMQETWERKLDWSDKLPLDLEEQFIQLLEELPRMQEITVPRCVLPSYVLLQEKNL